MPVGFDGKCYYDSSLDYASPVWVEMVNARDVDNPMSTDEVENSDRGSPYKKYDAGQHDLTHTVEYTYRNGDTVLEALRTIALARGVVQAAFMDGDIATTGSEGWRGFYIVSSHDWTQPLQDGQVVTLTFRPTHYDDTGTIRDPEWYTVPAGP